MSLGMTRFRLLAAMLLVWAFILGGTFPAVAGEFYLYYERVVFDAFGNEIGTQKVRINSYEDLPVGNPWRAYLTQLMGTRTIFSYTKEIAASLNRPLILTISDASRVSTSSKTSAGYAINLYKHITQYSTPESQKFVLLHEIGHVAMLNAYPSSYQFSNLDYGADNRHYLDEILPNTNTAWVEGWANAFAALKNDGLIFNLSIVPESIVAFLKGNTFEEMTRNELFIAKVLYDAIKTFPNGQDRVFQAIARTGPHSSLLEFCRGYLKLYPGDQIALAALINRISHGKVSLKELLDHVNNGSYTVSSEMYAWLQQNNKLTGYTATTNSPTTTSTGGSVPKPAKLSFWDRFKQFFSGLFGAKAPSIAAQPSQGGNISIPPQEPTFNPASGEVLTSHAAPEAGLTAAEPSVLGNDLGAKASPQDLVKAQEEYYQAFAQYNDALSKHATDSQAVKQARERLRLAKERINQIQAALK
jgi:hypothetical protein